MRVQLVCMWVSLIPRICFREKYCGNAWWCNIFLWAVFSHGIMCRPYGTAKQGPHFTILP